VQFNGDYLGYESIQCPDYDENVSNGDVLIKTSALKTTGTRSSFELTFKKNY
jgi:hypothetical protein